MALSYGFFNAELTQSGQYDRVYAAEQFAEYFHLIVSNGVFPDPATQLQVVASNTPDMNVNVSDGYGWINGYFAKNSGSYPLAIQAASGTLNRVDAVVLRWVNASRSMELAVKTGIAASSPATPALQRDTDVYEIMLATVTVAAGATSIPQSAITDKRADTSVCGWVTGAVQNIDTTNLFAQYDAAFQAWFEDIKAQLEGNVATNLLNRINAVDAAKVNISDKASESEAVSGTNDSKWMTPLKVKKAIGTAPDTVLEESTGNRVTTVQKGFRRRTVKDPMWFYGVSSSQTAAQLSISPRRISTDTYNTMFFDSKAANGGEIIALGTVKSSRSTSDTAYYHPAWGRISALNAKNKQLPTVKFYDRDSEINNSYEYLVASSLGYSINNDVMVVRQTNDKYDSYFLLDIKNNVMSSIPYSSKFTAFATESYWGIIYQDSYRLRSIYFAPRGTVLPDTSTSLGSGTSSNYYRLNIVGVTGDTIYLIEPVSKSNWRLNKISWNSGAVGMVSGLSTFDFSAYPWNQTSSYDSTLSSILYDDRYAYVYVHGYTGSTQIPCAHVLKIDMSTEATNWNEISPSQKLSSDALDSSRYIGSLPNGKAYYYYYSNDKNHWMYTLDKNTALISEEVPWTTAANSYYSAKFRWHREQVFNLDIGAYIWTGSCLFNPEMTQWIIPTANINNHPLKFNSSANVVTSDDITPTSASHSYGVQFIGTEVTGTPPILASTRSFLGYFAFIDCAPDLVLEPYTEEK